MHPFNYNSFLKQIKLLNDRYSKLAKITGENFNVFRILNVERSEKTHTAFIAELLNPKGRHGQGHAFLDLFIKATCFKGNPITASSCKVEVEKHIGFKSSDRLQGGRIDIQITDTSTNHLIIIENKIHASDVDSQLISYFNHAPNADLIYLTLDGKDPVVESSHHLEKDVHFKCLSYKKDIVNWLELCRGEVAIQPIVRETITIYINTIKRLTNQTINHAMKEELSEIIKSNIQASFIISDSLDATLNTISDNYVEELSIALKKEHIDCYANINLHKPWSGLFINKPNWKYYNIGFQFQEVDKELIYGLIAKQDTNNVKIPKLLADQLKNLPGSINKSNRWWAWLNPIESPFDNWSKFQAWEAMMDGKMLHMMLEKVNDLLLMTKDVEL